jgi:hypothetical protein
MENARLEAEVTSISDKGLVTVQVADTDELKRQASEGQLGNSIMVQQGKLLFPASNLDAETSFEDLAVGTRVSLRLTVDGGRARANEVKIIS